MSFKKEIEKIVLLQVKNLIYIIVKFKALCHSPVNLLRGEPLNTAIGHQVVCRNKGMN